MAGEFQILLLFLGPVGDLVLQYIYMVISLDTELVVGTSLIWPRHDGFILFYYNFFCFFFLFLFSFLIIIFVCVCVCVSCVGAAIQTLIQWTYGRLLSLRPSSISLSLTGHIAMPSIYLFFSPSSFCFSSLFYIQYKMAIQLLTLLQALYINKKMGTFH